MKLDESAKHSGKRVNAGVGRVGGVNDRGRSDKLDEW